MSFLVKLFLDAFILFSPAERFFALVGNKLGKYPFQFRNAVAGDCRSRNEFFFFGGECFFRFFNSQVGFVQGDGVGLFDKFGVELFEFLAQGLEIFPGVFVKGVDDEEERVGSFDVFQKFVPESLTFAGTFDKARNIGDDKASGIFGADAENRFQSGKGVVADFGAGTGNLVYQGGFSGVGKADQSDIRDDYEL